MKLIKLLLTKLCYSLVFLSQISCKTKGLPLNMCPENSPNISQELITYNLLLAEAINSSSYSQKNYEKLSEVISFMQKHTAAFNPIDIIKCIMLVGATGAGKSTLCNYLREKDNLIVTEKRLLQVKEDGLNVSKIGSGKCSTTLFPISCKMPFGTIIDCAGEGDTRGVIAQAINSYIKWHMAKKIKQLKILFIAPQTSLGHECGYGVTFKNALDTNSNFLGDINYFTESIGMIITNAEKDPEEEQRMRDPNYAVKWSTMMIKSIIEGETSTNISLYKHVLENIIERNKIKSFLKPSSKPGDIYKDPMIKPNQRKEIIEFITDLPYTEVPNENFFKVSFSLEVKESMACAREIIKLRAVQELNKALITNQNLSLYTLELKPFSKFIKTIKEGKALAIYDYVNMLKEGGFLEVNFDNVLLDKLSEELKYLNQFMEKFSNEIMLDKKIAEFNWFESLDVEVKELLNNLYEDATIILSQQNYILNPLRKGTITTKFSSQSSNDILKNIQELLNLYESKADLDAQKTNINSRYYQEVDKQIQIGENKKTRQVPNGTKKIPNGTKENFSGVYRDEPYFTTEYIDVQEQCGEEKIYTKHLEKQYLCKGEWVNEKFLLGEHTSNNCTIKANSLDGSLIWWYYTYNGPCGIKKGIMEMFTVVNPDQNANREEFKKQCCNFLLNTHQNMMREVTIDSGQKKPIFKTVKQAKTVENNKKVPIMTTETIYIDEPQFREEEYTEPIMQLQRVIDFDNERYTSDVQEIQEKINNKETILNSLISIHNIDNTDMSEIDIVATKESERQAIGYMKNLLKIEYNSFFARRV